MTRMRDELPADHDRLTIHAIPAARQALLVARREYRENVRTRTFRNGVLFTVVLIALVIAGISIVPAVFGGDADVRLGAVLPEAAGVVEAVPAQLGDDSVQVVPFRDRADAEAALLDGDVEAVLVGDAAVVVEDQLDPQLATMLQAAASTARLAADLGASPTEVVASAAVALDVTALDPVDPDLERRRWLVFLGVMIALGQVMGGAFMVAYGVVEEKSSRVVEVVIAKARPRVILAGKLVGLGLVNLLQLAIFVAAGLLGMALSPDLSIPEGLLAASGMILVWFLLAYAIFAALFSIAGAITARMEDMQQKVMPAMYTLFVVFGAAIYAANNPDHLLATVATYVPLTAPGVAPLLDATVGLVWWQTGLAMVSTLAGAAAAIWIAGSVYTGGALRLRGRTTVRQALNSD